MQPRILLRLQHPDEACTAQYPTQQFGNIQRLHQHSVLPPSSEMVVLLIVPTPLRWLIAKVRWGISCITLGKAKRRPPLNCQCNRPQKTTGRAPDQGAPFRNRLQCHFPAKAALWLEFDVVALFSPQATPSPLSAVLSTVQMAALSGLLVDSLLWGP